MPIQATASAIGMSVTVGINLWYGRVALALVVIGGIIGLVDSLAQNRRKMLLGGDLVALLSIIIFAAGLQYELSSSTVISGAPIIGLFSSGSFSVNYTIYLSFGFWIAPVAAVLMLVASTRKPSQMVPQPPPPP